MVTPTYRNAAVDSRHRADGDTTIAVRSLCIPFATPSSCIGGAARNPDVGKDVSPELVAIDCLPTARTLGLRNPGNGPGPMADPRG